MSTANERVLSRLKRKEEPQRKTLSIPLKPEHIENLDRLAKAITQHSGITTTRNMLIEDAVESFLEEATATLIDEGIDLDVVCGSTFDTLVLPAQMNRAYEEAWFNDREWRFVRVSKDKIPYIRYITLYVGAPQSAIKHYAEVAPNGFVYDEEQKKYRIRLKGSPIELPHPIPLGSTASALTRSLKYTTLEKLLSANEYRDLFI